MQIIDYRLQITDSRSQIIHQTQLWFTYPWVEAYEVKWFVGHIRLDHDQLKLIGIAFDLEKDFSSEMRIVIYSILYPPCPGWP